MLFAALAPLTGALITLMNAVNSRLSAAVGYPTAAVVVHLVGLIGVQALVLARREPRKPGRLPLVYYLGGIFGAGTVFAGNYAFSVLSASLAVALALVGQAAFSLIADATGLFGRKRYPPSALSLPGIGLAAVGVIVMAGRGRLELAAVLAALAMGILPGLSFILNSELGLKKGILRAARWNFRTGLAVSLLTVVLVRPPIGPAVRAVVEAGAVLSLGGGLMGLVVVVFMNYIFPRMPAFSATILLFAGQTLTGVLLDRVTQGAFEIRKIAGTLILISGLAVNALLARRRTERTG